MRPDPKRSVSSRRLHARCALLLLAGGIAAHAAAQAPMSANAGEAYSIALRPATAQGVATLAIDGTWPTPCTPTFDAASLQGTDLRIEARAVLNLCTRQATPYVIEIDPAAALQRPALPAGVYHVSYYAADGTQAQPKLRAFALVDTTSGGEPAFAPETGFWWSTSGAGPAAGRNVFSIESQGSQLTVALMSYDRDGRGSWQFGTGTLRDTIAHVPLLQIAGGGDPFSGAGVRPHGMAGLMLDLEFHSNALATAWLTRPSAADGALQMQTLDLVRLPFANPSDGSAWKGDWVLAADADGAAPQRLHFTRVMALDATTFRLGDTGAGIFLDCALDSNNAELPPPRCILRRRDGSELGRLDAIAITRMDGVLANGVPVHLLRVKP